MKSPSSKDLLAACDQLIELVEGVRAPSWRAHGKRLSDSPEWIAFFMAFDRLSRRSRAKSQPSGNPGKVEPANLPPPTALFDPKVLPMNAGNVFKPEQ
jgi:hypothetical protein